MKPLGDLGQAAADASEHALEYEASLLPMPEDPKQWMKDALNEVKALRNDHAQKEILLVYIKAGLRAIATNGINETNFKLHMLLVTKHWPQIAAEKAQAGREKAGNVRAKQLADQGAKTRKEVLEYWDECKVPDCNKATLVASKAGVSAQHVRNIISEEKRK